MSRSSSRILGMTCEGQLLVGGAAALLGRLATRDVAGFPPSRVSTRLTSGGGRLGLPPIRSGAEDRDIAVTAVAPVQTGCPTSPGLPPSGFPAVDATKGSAARRLSIENSRSPHPESCSAVRKSLGGVKAL